MCSCFLSCFFFFFLDGKRLLFSRTHSLSLFSLRFASCCYFFFAPLHNERRIFWLLRFGFIKWADELSLYFAYVTLSPFRDIGLDWKVEGGRRGKGGRGCEYPG